MRISRQETRVRWHAHPAQPSVTAGRAGGVQRVPIYRRGSTMAVFVGKKVETTFSRDLGEGRVQMVPAPSVHVYICVQRGTLHGAFDVTPLRGGLLPQPNRNITHKQSRCASHFFVFFALLLSFLILTSLPFPSRPPMPNVCAVSTSRRILFIVVCKTMEREGDEDPHPRTGWCGQDHDTLQVAGWRSGHHNPK